MKYLIVSILSLAVLPSLLAAGSAETSVRVLSVVPAGARSTLYPGNREPLRPSPLMKLPLGHIVPKGWVRSQLELEARGMTGHLPELSHWCKFEGSAWAAPDGKGSNGWEELPYWLKGYGDLGYVLRDERIIAESRKWIDAMLASQEADGWFGPRALKTGLKGKPDLWPHMVMCNVLQSFYEFSNDPRVLPFLTRYFTWLNNQPAETFGQGYWPKIRFGDNLETVYWLYNRTAEPFLLELAEKIHRHMQDWSSGVHDWHNVNLAQGFREPAVYFQQSLNAENLQAADRNYRQVMDIYGQFPGGGFAGDENCRPGFTDPRQGFETCGMVEFMHSFEMLTRISGDPRWSERCEDIAFNSFPAALTPDWKGLHYLTSANQVQLDKNNKAPGIENSGTMFSYSPGEVYRCCQHNVSHGWPYYAEELWLATADHGLCLSLYSASELEARVGEGVSVRITEATQYPFGEEVRLNLSPAKAVRFPLYLRLPGWCEKPVLRINGKRARIEPEFDRGAAAAASTPSSRGYLRLERTWQAGDEVRLELPATLRVQRWPGNQDAASVYYGPLAFSLDIKEQWKRYGGSDAWPEFEVYAGSPWNYALILDQKHPTKGLKVHHRPGGGTPGPQVFSSESVPLSISAKAVRVPEWSMDSKGLVEKVPPSPVQRAGKQVETITLIPMGAARLRISSFPVAN